MHIQCDVWKLIIVSCFQVSNNSTASLFIIEANDTDAKADNGMYNCQITLVIAGMDNFSSASNYSEISLEGTTYMNSIIMCLRMLIKV